MTNPRHNEYEVIFVGQHLRLLWAGHAEDGSSRLLKTSVDDAAGPSALAKLAHEYDVCRDLDVSGVLRLISKETIKGRPALVFEDPGGTTLAQLLDDGPVDLPFFFHVAIELVGIVGRLHRKGIVHKDIHSGNIIICTNCDPVRVYLTGLGIASLLAGQSVEKTAPHKLEGTLAVMSPEQTGRMNRPVDFRTDFYSLGAVCYQMLTGTPPFTGDDPLELVFSHLAVKPQVPSKINPRIPPVLSDLVLKLLAKDADDRFRSAAGIAADLKRCQDDWHFTGAISAFELARQDVSETFHIPDKLYGRQDEIRSLQTTFERTCGGPVELLLVTGDAGIGKTELVNQLRRPVLQKDGYFNAGKCDPLDRKIPCAPFVEAISDTVDQLLARPQERIDRAVKILAQTLGNQGRVLTDVIPMLSLIIGEQPTVPELPPDQARNRFHLMIQRLYSAATIMKRTVVVFLDDLQWADLSTLKMLQTLACDTDLRNVLLIGAYRDQEVDETHGLVHTLKEIAAAGGRIQTLALGPMPAIAVSALIADALDSPSASTADLAALCHQKTGGNPFFLKRFLLELVAQELIFFNATRNKWQWHTNKIALADVTDNVVELMAKTIEGLDDKVQQALKTAACIGNQFDLGTLCAVHDRPPQALLDHLWTAVQSGLISVLPGAGLRITRGPDGTALPTVITADAVADEIRFAFIHDRIHEAAYGLIATDKKMSMHLRIGRLMLDSCPSEELGERIYNILGQLNRTVDLITEAHERETLVRLNLEAGKKAQATALFESAFHYFQAAISLLDSSSWQAHYGLTKEIYAKGLETAAASGHHTEFHQWFEAAKKIRAPFEKIDAYIYKLQVENATGRYMEGLKAILDILSQLGIELKLEPSEADLAAATQKATTLVNQYRTQNLDLPILKDPIQRNVQHLLAVSTIATYYVNPHLKKMMISKGIGHCIQHGLSDFSAVFLMEYAANIHLFNGTEEDAYTIGCLGLDLLGRFENKVSALRSRHLFHIWILPLNKHFRESVAPLTRAYHTGLEIGDILFACYNLTNAALVRFYKGDELTLVAEKMAATRKALQKHRHQTCIVMINLCCQFMMNMMGKSKHTILLAGDFFDERVVFPKGRPDRNDFFFDMVSIYKLMLSFFFEDFSEANRLAALLEHSVYVETHPYCRSRFLFYSSLSCLAVWETLSSQERTASLEKVWSKAQQLQSMAKAAPVNYLHLLHLVNAERARVEGRIFEAQEHFDWSIELARENSYLYDQALANELAAKFWMDRGKKLIAQLHMQQALDCYTRWGAAAKVRDLQERLSEFFTEERSGTLIRTETWKRATALDVLSALRASRAISGEIVLDRLIGKLMSVVIENAGATCGRLLLESDGLLYVAAEAGADRPEKIFQPDQGVAVENASHLLPLQLVQYVRRTRKPVAMEDAQTHERFARDPYILKNHPRSVLCSPIVRQDKLIGLLYLENNLADRVFTDERLQMLEILSAQIAVSLENARLYNSLEKLVKIRTDELVELAVAKEQAEAANQAKNDFLARMSHEIRTPINAVTGFTNIVLKSELTDKQHDYLKKVQIASNHLLELINDLFDYSKMEADQLMLMVAPFDLDQVMEQLADLFSNRVGQKNLKLIFTMAPDVPRQLVGDAGRLTQMLANLLENAVKFTETGEIVVAVELVEPAIGDQVIDDRWARETTLKFSVSDTGVGIAADVLPTLFDPFTQAENYLTRKHGGTGLGLAICRQLVQLMGGRIWAESILGKGSIFSFTVMLETRMERPEAAAQRPPQEPGALPIQHLAGRRVLVVEDSELNLVVALALLEEIGLTIETAENGQVAVDKLTDSEPGYYDAVLMDIQMPVMNGYEATRKIREWEAIAQITDHRIPIIALTAHGLIGEKEKCMAAGMDDYLAKPLDEQDLHRVLLKWITPQQGR